MKNWLEDLQNKLQLWMQGRYGLDNLSKSLFILSLVFLLLSPRSSIFNLMPLIIFAFVSFRSHSKDIAKRQGELRAYLLFTGKIKQVWNLQKNKIRQGKTHRYFKCPNCKSDFRVPRGKGKIRISCPKCGHQIIKRT
ncbi:MAG: hypothetical protein GX046_07065 [Tissierellia bacterium]|nr:hypothetical protein [Tissierellia bacterium]